MQRFKKMGLNAVLHQRLRLLKFLATTLGFSVFAAVLRKLMSAKHNQTLRNPPTRTSLLHESAIRSHERSRLRRMKEAAQAPNQAPRLRKCLQDPPARAPLSPLVRKWEARVRLDKENSDDQNAGALVVRRRGTDALALNSDPKCQAYFGVAVASCERLLDTGVDCETGGIEGVTPLHSPPPCPVNSEFAGCGSAVPITLAMSPALPSPSSINGRFTPDILTVKATVPDMSIECSCMPAQ